jgi:hypothetical protein
MAYLVGPSRLKPYLFSADEIRRMLVATMELGPQISSSRDSKRDLPLPPRYRGGQLVVEYATVCFRSQEDFGPIPAIEFLPTRKVLLDLRLEFVGGVSHHDLLQRWCANGRHFYQL